jgi:opacity protein-like surface antigen
MRNLLLAGAAVIALSASALAADMPVKAPPMPVATAYPYTTAGAYWGITTYASDTTFNVNAPGTNTGEVSAIGGSIGVLLGYSMPINSGAEFVRFEGSAAAQNLNGTSQQTAGILSMKGPWRLEGVAEVGMPCANIVAYLPANLGSLLPTLPALPTGLVATNCHAYVGGGIAGEDISANLTPAGSQGSEWSAAGVVKTGQIWQLANGYAVDTWVEYESNGRSIGLNTGGPMFTPSIQGQAHKIIAGINFDF